VGIWVQVWAARVDKEPGGAQGKVREGRDHGEKQELGD
jgi:hypothetical protein